MGYVASGYVAAGYVETAETLPSGYPAESDVRLGAVYGPNGEYVGAYVGATTNVNVTHINGSPVIGTGQIGDDWRGEGVQPQ